MAIGLQPLCYIEVYGNGQVLILTGTGEKRFDGRRGAAKNR